VAVHGKRAGLNDEDIGAADVFEYLEINLTIAEAVQLGLAYGYAQMLADRGRQRRIGGTREDFETLVVHTLLARSPVCGDKFPVVAEL